MAKRTEGVVIANHVLSILFLIGFLVSFFLMFTPGMFGFGFGIISARVGLKQYEKEKEKEAEKNG